MMVKTLILSIVCGVFCLLPCWAEFPCAQAATAQKQPVAQQPPVAKKPPVAKSQPKARAAAAPRQKSQTPPKSTASSAKKTPSAALKAAANQTAANAGQSDPLGDPLKKSLDAFAHDCIVTMNKHRKPGIGSKEVTRQPDGTYMARYMAVDMDSLVTSYNPTNGNKTIKYIGRMIYHEVEYVSTGKNQKQAMAGPFNESNRTPITELIKYKAGKWTY